MDDLGNLLEQHKKTEVFSFSTDFDDAVMNRIHQLGDESPRRIRIWEKRIWTAAAACIVGILISAYALDGTITLDSILGLSEHSSVEVSQSIDTYNQWSLE